MSLVKIAAAVSIAISFLFLRETLATQEDLAVNHYTTHSDGPGWGAARMETGNPRLLPGKRGIPRHAARLGIRTFRFILQIVAIAQGLLPAHFVPTPHQQPREKA
jgi:hypothetical protein